MMTAASEIRGIGVTYLAETLDVLPQHFALALLDGEEAPRVPSRVNDPERFVKNCSHNSPQDPTDPGGRIINHERPVPQRATWK